MIDETKKKTGTRTALELALAVVGGWFAASALMAIAGSEQSHPLCQPVVVLMSWIGAWPTLALSLGLAVVGSWSFLAQLDFPLGQHALGALGTGLGLSIGLGGLRSGAGGELGTLLPSLLPSVLGAALGAGLGLAVVLAAAWLAAWLPEDAGFSRKAEEEEPVRAANTSEGDDGVSAEEAQALITPPPRVSLAAHLPRTPTPADDVRTRGGVPAGARALTTTYDEPRSKAQVHAIEADRPATPGGRGGEPFGAHLAAPGTPAGRSGGLLGREVRPPEPGAQAPRPLAEAHALDERASETPVRPSWESAALEDERSAARTAAWEADEEASADVFAAQEGLRTLQPDEELEVVEDEDELELEEVAFDDEDAELEDEEEEEEEEEEDGGEEDSAEEFEHEELAAASASEELNAEDEEQPSSEPEAFREVALGSVVDTALEPEPETAPEPEARRSKRKAKEVQTSLFDEVGDGAGALADVEIPPAPRAPSKAKAKRAPAAVPPEKPAAAVPSELVLEAGTLILEENRVAVSMLQRRFGLDFDAATEVLDQLQGLGLIGPYLGGKTRAILMNREEWMALANGV
jgi:DNA segregation ATPase FtsK/SpoIIIE-like protein